MKSPLRRPYQAVARIREQIAPSDASNFSVNRRLWDAGSRNWDKRSVTLSFEPASGRERYVESKLEFLGDEWSEPEAVDEIVSEFIRPFVTPESVVGEIGVGGARVASRVAPHVGKLYCFDIAPAMLARAKKALAGSDNVEYVLLRKPVFPREFAGAFDFVYSFDVFVHLDLHGMWRYFQEVARVLRCGGRAFIHTSNLAAPDGWARFASQEEYSVLGHYFVSPEIVQILSARSGFAIIKQSVPDPSNIYLNRDLLVVLKKLPDPRSNAGRGEDELVDAL